MTVIICICVIIVVKIIANAIVKIKTAENNEDEM